MPSKKCDYCDAKSHSKQSLTSQGWESVISTIGVGKETAKFRKRACPLHRKDLARDLEEFMGKNSKTWQRLEERDRVGMVVPEPGPTRDPEDYIDQRGNC